MARDHNASTAGDTWRIGDIAVPDRRRVRSIRSHGPCRAPPNLAYAADVATKFLDDGAIAAFRRAVEAIETASAVEVVVALRRQSAAYRHANVAVSVVASFCSLAAMLFSSHPFRLTSILIDTFVVAMLSAAIVEVLPSVKRALTPRSRRRAAIAQAANATFVQRHVHATARRSGLLVYISWLEQEVALVPDLGLARELPAERLLQAQSALTEAMRHGGSAVAHALEQLAQPLANAMPSTAHDVNELPDAVDSDLERSR